jgi:hypothetical protein
VATAPYPEGDLRVATFGDPADNVIGVWQRAYARRERTATNQGPAWTVSPPPSSRPSPSAVNQRL